MIYAVIDTNVLVSALLSRHSDAATVQVVKAVFEKTSFLCIMTKSLQNMKITMSKEDAYLVTGNTKHFPKSPIVVTPAEMLDILNREIV